MDELEQLINSGQFTTMMPAILDSSAGHIQVLSLSTQNN